METHQLEFLRGRPTPPAHYVREDSYLRCLYDIDIRWITDYVASALRRVRVVTVLHAVFDETHDNRTLYGWYYSDCTVPQVTKHVNEVYSLLGKDLVSEGMVKRDLQLLSGRGEALAPKFSDRARKQAEAHGWAFRECMVKDGALEAPLICHGEGRGKAYSIYAMRQWDEALPLRTTSEKKFRLSGENGVKTPTEDTVSAEQPLILRKFKNGSYVLSNYRLSFSAHIDGSFFASATTPEDHLQGLALWFESVGYANNPLVGAAIQSLLACEDPASSLRIE